MEENKRKKHSEESDSDKEKFESIDKEINILYQMIEDGKTMAFTIIFEKLAQLGDKYGDKLKIKLQDKLIFEENIVEQYSLEEAIVWFKENYSDTIENASGGLFKMSEKRRTKETKIYHFFINEIDKKVLTGKEYPFKLVKAGKLDKELQDQFGNDDLIIFK